MDTFVRLIPRLLTPLTLLGRAATKALPFGVLLGIVLPDLATLARPYFAHAIFVMLTLALVRVDLSQAKQWAGKPAPVLMGFCWILFVCPVLILLMISPLAPLMPSALATAAILFAACPPVLSSASLAVLLRLDAPFAILVMLGTTLLSPFTVPPLVFWLTGVQLDISVAGLMVQLGLLVVGASLVAALIRGIMGAKRRSAYATEFDGLLVLCMLVFACGIMAGITEILLETPIQVLQIILFAFAINLLLQAACLPVMATRFRALTPTLMLMSGNKNMGLLMAAVGGVADPMIFLFFALAQFPIYSLPSLMHPIYQRIASRH